MFGSTSSPSPALVTLFVHAPTTYISSERRINVHESFDTLCGRLEQITGIPPAHQVLQVWSGRTDDPDAAAAGGNLRLVWQASAADGSAAALGDTAFAQLVAQGSKGAGGATLEDGMGLKILDDRPDDVARRFREDDESVEKYEMTEEEYQKRADTVLAYKQRHKLGRFDPQAQAAADQERQRRAALPLPTVGSRAQVLGETQQRRGVVRFVGPVAFAPPPPPPPSSSRSGTSVDQEGESWVGIEFDEPVGKNDGSVQGTRYFTCQVKHGGFFKPDKIAWGDEYAPLGLGAEDEDDFDLDEEI